MLDSGEGSDVMRSILPTWMRSSATTWRTCVSTLSMRSPGRMRKLTTARAFDGSTFSFTPDRKIVGAVVVRTRAFVVGVFSSERTTRGSKSQRFESITRLPNGMWGASACISRRGAPRRRAGIGWRWRRSIAAARSPIAVSGGGRDEWPPSVSATSSTLTYPFSAIPMDATGSRTPGTTPWLTNRPSSST